MMGILIVMTAMEERRALALMGGGRRRDKRVHMHDIYGSTQIRNDKHYEQCRRSLHGSSPVFRPYSVHRYGLRRFRLLYAKTMMQWTYFFLSKIE
jgi:hypothetical protein